MTTDAHKLQPYPANPQPTRQLLQKLMQTTDRAAPCVPQLRSSGAVAQHTSRTTPPLSRKGSSNCLKLSHCKKRPDGDESSRVEPIPHPPGTMRRKNTHDENKSHYLSAATAATATELLHVIFRKISCVAPRLIFRRQAAALLFVGKLWRHVWRGEQQQQQQEKQQCVAIQLR